MSFPSRYPLIINPKAKSERAKQAMLFLKENLTRFVIYATNNAEEARLLAKTFADQGEDIVVAAGGDGTLNAVIQGLAGSKTTLGVLPTGTMNVFAREMGIPANHLQNALRILDERHIQEVDLFQANEMFFLQMAGLGFDAKVIEETSEEQKKRFGPLAYLISAMKVLGDQPPKMEVCLDENRVTEGVCVLVGNGSLYGGQIRLFGQATNSDELLDVLVFKTLGYEFVRDSLKGLVQGGFNDHHNTVEYYQTNHLEVRCDRNVPLELDGDLKGHYQKVRFCNKDQKKLKVLAPNNPEPNWLEETVRHLSPWIDSP